MNLQLTSAARLAIAPGGAETRAVRLTRIAIGAGRGPGGAADADRVALRNPRDAGAVVAGDASGIARLTGSATIAPTGAYSVGEVGVFGRTVASDGALGDEILLAFWTHPSEVLAAAVVGAAIVIAVVVDVRAGSASTTITTSAPISFPAPQALTDLADTPGVLAEGLLRVSADEDAVAIARAGDVVAQLSQQAPMRLLAFDAAGAVVAPAAVCTWLVAAWGAGGGGLGNDDTAAIVSARPAGEVLPGAGTATQLSLPASAVVVAAGGTPRSGLRAEAAWRTDAGGVSVGDLIIPGAGAAGGRGYKGAQGYRYSNWYSGATGRAGDFVLAVIRPRSGERYSVTIGAGGRGGRFKPTTPPGLAGSPGRLLIVEFR